jgi:hypothetical protein
MLQEKASNSVGRYQLFQNSPISNTLSTIIFQSLRHSDFSVLDGQDFINPG